MDRRSTIAPRNLSLTEELERLEQSITLTLQEIDHNFSRAHRIVTGSILPIVEQYGKHSEAVWEGSKFWKQFFEAAANVSLNSYEEQQEELTGYEDEGTLHGDDTHPEASSSQLDESIASLDRAAQDYSDVDILSSPSIGGGRHSTPRMPPSTTNVMSTGKRIQPTFTPEYSSPYEALKREVDGKKSGKAAVAAPTTPSARNIQELSMTPDTSPFNPNLDPTASMATHANKDTILHQGILNKNYRIQATPLTTKKNSKIATTPGTTNRTRRLLDFEDSMSSPLEEAPRLRAFSPVKGPRTPGRSVLTPRLKREFEERRKSNPQTQAEAGAEPTGGRATGGFTRSIAWDSDSDEDDLEMSPPKTIVFNMPESRVLQTPAQEASRRIVDDIMFAAGDDGTGEIEDSPSIIGRRIDPLDDTF